ncbi:Endonuclease/exonuclease/phosphatase, partial [Piptocephalis cylindrospora]
LQVLTLNCWGLKFVSKNRPGRMRAIGRALTTTTAEIIALQEVWVEEDYQVLRTLVSSRLPYTHRFLSGILGGGLVLLSKYPIIESEFRPYSLGGCPSRFYHGDWFVGKGIGRCRVLHPELGPLDILNTHFHAEYGKKYPYAAERAAQAWEVGKALRACTATTIMMGDFNLVQDSLPYQIIRALVPARDAWVSKRPQALEETSANSLLEPWERARALGVTCDAPDNTWTDGDKDGLGERLDYIWIRDESVGIKEVSVVFTERVLSLNCSFSDHFAVEATLEM